LQKIFVTSQVKLCLIKREQLKTFIFLYQTWVQLNTNFK